MYIYMIGLYSSIKKNKLLNFEGKSTGLEDILCEIPLHQKYKSHMSP